MMIRNINDNSNCSPLSTYRDGNYRINQQIRIKTFLCNRDMQSGHTVNSKMPPHKRIQDTNLKDPSRAVV
jgi:hypothetical protein